VQPPPGVGQEVGEEHVGGLHQLHEDGVGVGVLEGEADAALAAVRVLHQRLERAVRRAAGSEAEAALRVAGLGVLDLDHVGAPVGEDRAGRRGDVNCATSTTRTPDMGLSATAHLLSPTRIRKGILFAPAHPRAEGVCSFRRWSTT